VTLSTQAGSSAACGSPLIFGPTQITSPDNRCNPQPGDPSHQLPPSAHPPVIAFHHTQDPISGPVTPALSKGTDGVGVFVPDVAHTLTSHSAKAGDPTTDPYVAPHGRVRRVTPLECERLQGFPDGWTDVPGGSDSARYRALGNSMAVPVLEWIGRGLLGE
jgi:DNA (cytosine-5)-methyltransferase 1